MRSAAGLAIRPRPDDPDGFTPDEFGQIQVEIRVGPRAAIGSLKRAIVTGKWTGDGTRPDVVGLDGSSTCTGEDAA
jgi:hypothetical protein